MTVAVLADVHGNYLALKACLDFAKSKGIETYLFLGDYITDHACPQCVMEQLYDMRNHFDCRFVRGNREEYMINYRAGKETGWKNCSAQGALLYTYENLTDRDIDWFEAMDIAGTWQPDGMPPIAYCHGSPERVKGNGVRYPEDAATLELLTQFSGPILVKGHNHRQWSFSAEGKKIVCPGSVGNAVGGTPKTAKMALLHEENGQWREELLQVPYDWQGALEALETSGLTKRAPTWAAMLKDNVLTGSNFFVELPSRAQELYRIETGTDAAWAEVPEAYWEQAAEEFGVTLF